MSEADDEVEWPHPRTVFKPMSALDGALAARLAERHQSLVERGLTIEEREYASGYPPPVVEVGTEPDGQLLLRISFGGGVATTAWDGSEEDAVALVTDMALNASDSASADYWLDSGWRTRPMFPGPQPDQ